jgi:16S rRNA (uracil1498-N3)-methyltransferase
LVGVGGMTTRPVFLVDALPDGAETVLTGTEGWHAAAVRRLRPGEPLCLVDGRGGLADCTVTAAERDQLRLTVDGRRRLPPPRPLLVVAQALAKGDRGELAVELMTELGVDVVLPWAASRSVVRWQGERGSRALARWRSTARAAAKQCRRAWLPEVGDLHGTAEVGARIAAAAAAIVLHEAATAPLAALPLPADGELVVVVGPEGGISEAELAAFVAAGAEPARLGDTVLRTSTAGAAALAVLAVRTGRWT